jgi:hypothetical protein
MDYPADKTGTSTPTVLEDSQLEKAEVRHVISPSAGTLRRSVVLVVMCLAMFIDAFNTGAMIICLNSVRASFFPYSTVLTVLVDWYRV